MFKMSSPMQNNIRVLAIDPGYDRLGLAILDRNQGKDLVVFSDCVITDRSSSHPDRLLDVGSALEQSIKKYSPSHFAIEKLFFTNNQKTALAVSEVRGLCLFLAKKYSLEVYEYTPNQIKVATTGNGRATKKDVILMVQKLIKFNKNKALDDEYDAIACGITHLASVRFPQK